MKTILFVLTWAIAFCVAGVAVEPACAQSFSDKVLALNPAAYWRFEGNYTDSSGHGNTLIPYGNAGIATTGGVPDLGSAADLSGAGTSNGYYVATPAGSSLNFGGTQYSINLWYKNALSSAETTISAPMVNKRNSANWQAGFWDYGLWMADYGAPGDALRGTVATTHSFDSAPLSAPIAPIAMDEKNVWHMATVTWSKGTSWDNGAATLYLDGKLVGAALGSGSGLVQAAHRLILGNVSSPGDNFTGHYWKGALDEVAIFDTALSAADVANLYGAPVVPQQGLSRGHQILLERGLQIQALGHTQAWGYFDAARWAESHFTTYCSDGYALDPNLMPAAPGIPWSRIASGGVFDIDSAEVPYESSLVSYQLKDEPDLTDPSELEYQTAATAWFRVKHPNVMTFTNEYGERYSPAQLQTYMQQVKPDMLLFSVYPFDGRTIGGSPRQEDSTNWYADLQKYRLLSLAGNDGTGTQPTPYGIWLQTYLRLQTASPDSGHVVSESEIRLNQFSAWAFGATFAGAFVYDQPGYDIEPILFSGDGTNSPTPQFYQVAETNRQSRNLGPALVRLISTDVRMKPGLHKAGLFWVDTPNDLPDSVSSWTSGADPYLTNITVANQGSKNDGLAGDVIVGYFKPLDPSFTNPGHENDIYFMIVNGLTDPTGSAADTRQLIRLDFNFGASGIDSLLRLSRETGTVETVNLVHTGGSLYYLDLLLDGGTGDLFKFNNGGAFVAPGVPGDFNSDGAVDAADYVSWRKQGGTPSGYDLWRANFGQTSASGSGAATNTVPEPSAFVLLVFCAAGMSGLVWRARASAFAAAAPNQGSRLRACLFYR